MGFMDGITPESLEQAPDSFAQFKVGDNHARISKVLERTTKNGDPMLEITFTNEDGATIRYFIVKNEFGESKLKQVFLAFKIPFENLYSYSSWLHKWGIVVCKEGQPYNGKVYPEVSYVRPEDSRQASRPAEQHPAPQQSYSPPAGQAAQGDGEFTDDIPF